jgi:hypothetical protein
VTPRVSAETEAISVLFTSAGKLNQPVGVTLRAKGYNAQEENAQVINLKPSIHLVT